MSHIITGSGYLNNPVRTILIADDNRPGSYPVDISPVVAARSTQYTRPYRDNIMPDTPVVYSRATVTFNDRPPVGSSVTLKNAQPTLHTFTFIDTDGDLETGSNPYNVSLFFLHSGGTLERDVGLDRFQVSLKRIAERFIDSVNAATGSMITASPTGAHNVVLLTQNIPGSAGNNSDNSSTTTAVNVEFFTGGNGGNVRYPYGISVRDGAGSSESSEIVRRLLSTSVSGTMDVPTSGRASLVSAYSDQHPYGVYLPYDESNSHQAFGAVGGSREYGTRTRFDDDFFTRGSVSGSLDEPLWVKDKIVIDLTPVVSTTISFNPNTNNQYHMMYFNHVSKKWDPIGLGTNASTTTSISAELDAHTIGFGQSYSNLASISDSENAKVIDKQLLSTYLGTKLAFVEGGWCTPTDTFGFPLHPKFHATSSQEFLVSGIIDRPFVIEKFIYEFSGSSAGGSAGVSKFRDAIPVPSLEFFTAGGTFFILNQRKSNPDPGQDNSYTNFYIAKSGSTFYPPPIDGSISYPEGNKNHYNFGGIPTTRQLSNGGSSIYVDDVRDLVTFARVGSIWPLYNEEIVNRLEENFPHPANFMDLAIEVPSSSSISGIYTLSKDIRSPSRNPSVSTYTLNFPSGPSTTMLYVSKDSSTRNSIDISTGRSLGGEFIGPEFSYSIEAYGGNETVRSYAPKKDFSNSPYVIRPGDHLIFGWQSHVSYTTSDNGPNLTLAPGAGKLILYGSYLRDDKPVHDIFKDQLNSDALHESIPTGPWVLDRFESDPQMCYTGSMREEHVTGTMVTKNEDGTLSVTDVNDFSIGGVRAISARVSDGDVGQRWSFFRNNRLFDSSEQYYDSMQPNPLDVLLSDSNVRIFESGSLFNAAILMLPGESFKFSGFPNLSSSIDSYANRSFLVSYPFQDSYAGISRVKKINSRIMSGRRVPSFAVSASDVVTFGTTTINGAILYATGTQPNGAQSNITAEGGILTSGRYRFLGLDLPIASPVTSQDDTNPTRDTLFFAVSSATDPQDNVNYFLSRLMGCFGDGFIRMIQYSNMITIITVDGTFLFVQKMNYRGTKHGLINPTPLFSNAVFNGTQYGQPRDMMEQRQYTRFSLSDDTLTDAAVSVLFVDRFAAPGTFAIVSGSATNSSNISKFATSEHPYDDALSSYGLIWDRSTPLPETLINI